MGGKEVDVVIICGDLGKAMIAEEVKIRSMKSVMASPRANRFRFDGK